MSKPTYIFKVPVAGDGAVGKTSLIVRYTQGTFTDTYKMTIGTSFAVKTVDLENVLVKLQIWDLAGQPHFGGVRPLFYQGSTGVIYVFSVTDRASFDHLLGWMEEARKNSGNVPGILVGNKTDLQDQRAVSREEAETFAAQTGLQYVETSAKLDENVGDAFRQVAITIIQTKWPEYGISKEEEPTPPEPMTPEAIEQEPEPFAPTLSEPEYEEPEPIEPIPDSESVPQPELKPEPMVESLEPEVTEISESQTLDIGFSETTEPEVPPELMPQDLDELVSKPPPAIPPSAKEDELAEEDIMVEQKTTSKLVEFVGVDLQTLPKDAFEKRAIHAMQRLGVSEVGVLGTFLRSLIHQGQRDVVIESLESLQEEH